MNMDLDPVALVIFWVTLIFAFAVLGRYIAKCCQQPGVLGELVIGVLIGNIGYFLGIKLFVILRAGGSVFNIMSAMLEGVTLNHAVFTTLVDPYYATELLDVVKNSHGVDLIKVGYILDIFARYGVIFLLFMVGLESSVTELKQSGRAATMVALLGMVSPIFLGFLVAYWLIPHVSMTTALFVAATLSATSIGITARVLSELKKLHTLEAKTILGAAMLDDVLGLVILAIVSSVVVNGNIDIFSVLQIIGSAVLFFASALLLGPWILRVSIKYFNVFALWEAKLFVSFLFVMLLAWFATTLHLASIIGSFVAGLIIHDNFFIMQNDSQCHNKQYNFSIKELVAPLEAILAPLFFTLIGIQVKLEAFKDWHVLGMAGGFIVAAVLGKLISGLGADKRCDRWLIGIGMLPRGEVGLIFASIGRSLGVLSDQVFASIVLMVFFTTLLAPPLLKMRYGTEAYAGK
jgi:Kef-type K+ transport system membrane component KefB